MQVFYPLLNYLSSNQDYYELVTNDWSENAKIAFLNETDTSFSSIDFKDRLKRSINTLQVNFYILYFNNSYIFW